MCGITCAKTVRNKFMSQRLSVFAHGGWTGDTRSFLSSSSPCYSFLLHLFVSLPPSFSSPSVSLTCALGLTFTAHYGLHTDTHAGILRTHTHTHTHTHTLADTVQSSTPHAASNFSKKAINPGVKKYSISTAPCCVPSPGPGSAMPYHNQFHKLN